MVSYPGKPDVRYSNLEPADTAIVHGVVLTMDEQRRIVTDGAIAIRDGRIIAVGLTEELLRSYRPARTLDARGGVVQPGFIDCHVHLTLHLGRGSIPDSWSAEREHEQWLPYWTNLNEEEANCAATLACMEMVRNGTTTFCDQSGRFSTALTAKAVASVGLKAILTRAIWDFPAYPEVTMGSTADCVERIERSLLELPRHADSRIWAGVGLAGMGSCSDELVQQAKRLADAHGAIMSMHQSFGPQDVARYRKLTGGKTASEHLEQLGALGNNLQLIHMIHTEETEVEILAKANTNVVHCPSASMRSAMGASCVGRFPEMIEGGVNVALGSDAGTYSDYFDIGRQAYLAATLHQEAKQRLPMISAHKAIEMATVGGARSLGILAETGSIEVGKRADIVVHSHRRPEWHPGHNVVNGLIFAAQSTGVDTVLVDGEPILEAGRFTRIDDEVEYERIDRAAKKLFERIGFDPGDEWPR